MVKRHIPSPSDAPAATKKDARPAAAGLAAPEGQDVLVARSVTINRSRHELYDVWRDFRNLPLFMENIEAVTMLDEKRSHWKVKAPADSTVEWDSVITEDVPGEVIAWQSVAGASVPNTGRIEFKDSSNGRGTIVTATIAYDPPGSKLGEFLAKMFGREPKIQARRDLRRFKQLMETNEIPSSQPPETASRGN